MEKYSHIFKETRDKMLNSLVSSFSEKKDAIRKPIDRIEKENKKTDKPLNITSLSVDDILLRYQEKDYCEIALKLVESNRLDDCLELTREIYDAETLWADGQYRSYFEPICENAVNNNDVDFLDSIKLVINQWLELLDLGSYLHYNLSFEEILAQTTTLIIDTYISLANKANKKDTKRIIKKAIDFHNSTKEGHKSFAGEYESTLLKFSNQLSELGFIEESEVMLNKAFRKEETFSWVGLFNYLYLKDPSLEELNAIAENIPKIDRESDSDFIFNWFNVPEINLGNTMLLDNPSNNSFLYANSGQSGLGPLLMKDANASLSESSVLNFLFLKYCKIDEYSLGRECLNKSINLIEEIDDMYIKSRGCYLIMTVLADALSCKLTDKDNYNKIFNDAIYYASLVRDFSGDFSCFCFKYKEHRYKGIVCDRCGKEVNGKGFKKIAFDYLFHSVSISKASINISNSSVDRILKNFKDDLERLDVICRILGFISNKKYVIFEHINSIINSLESKSIDAFLQKEDATLLEWYNQNIRQQTDIFEKLASIFPNGLSGYIQHQRDHFDHDDDFWDEEEFLDEVISNRHMWPEDLPDASIDEEDNDLLAEDVNANLHLLYIAEENQGISEDVVSKYLSDMDPNKIQYAIPELLTVYINLIRNYNKIGNDKDFNNSISHYLRFLNLLKDRKEVSNNYLSFLKLLIDIDTLDKHLYIIPYMNNKGDIDQFSDYFVSRYNFTESILFSTKINKVIRDSFSFALSNNFNKSKEFAKEKYMFLSNFNESTDSLFNYLKYEKNNIDQSNNEKANLLSEVFGNKTQKIEDSI